MRPGRYFHWNSRKNKYDVEIHLLPEQTSIHIWAGKRGVHIFLDGYTPAIIHDKLP